MAIYNKKLSKLEAETLIRQILEKRFNARKYVIMYQFMIAVLKKAEALSAKAFKDFPIDLCDSPLVNRATDIDLYLPKEFLGEHIDFFNADGLYTYMGCTNPYVDLRFYKLNELYQLVPVLPWAEPTMKVRLESPTKQMESYVARWEKVHKEELGLREALIQVIHQGRSVQAILKEIPEALPWLKEAGIPLTIEPKDVPNVDGVRKALLNHG